MLSHTKTGNIIFNKIRANNNMNQHKKWNEYIKQNAQAATNPIYNDQTEKHLKERITHNAS